MRSNTTRERATARVGTMLHEKWRLDALLGLGGMAAVYAATHRNAKRAAIKILHPELSIDATLVARFLREGQLANKVEHPGVVSVLDDGVAEDGASYLVMELLDGYSLEKHTEASPLPLPDALRVTDALLDVLCAAHAKGIVHRDIKPANLFLTRDGTLKVLDFGIARIREPSGGEAGFTQTGAAIGTPSYMPPEQARGRWSEVDARTDLWAVGATMLSLLRGTRARRAETVQEELLLAMTQPMPPAASLVPGLPPRIAAVLDISLAFERDRRFPDARTMQLELRRASGGTEEHFESTRVISWRGERAPLVPAGVGVPQGVALTPPPSSAASGPGLASHTPSAATDDRQLTTGGPLWVAAPVPTSPPTASAGRWAIPVMAIVALMGAGAFAWTRVHASHDRTPPRSATAPPPAATSPTAVSASPSPPIETLPTASPSVAAAPSASSGPPLPSASISANPSASPPARPKVRPPRGSASPADSADLFNQRF